MCVYVCMSVHTPTCVWRLTDNPTQCSSDSVTLFFKRAFLNGLELCSGASWPASELQRHAAAIPALQMTGVHCPICFSVWILDMDPGLHASKAGI